MPGKHDCQKEVHWREVTNLTSTSPNKNRFTLVRQLQLFLDKEGILCCGGQIHNAPLSELTKFPYLLPPKHPFTALVIRSIHSKVYHTGTIGTLTAITQSYWIPKGQQYVKMLLRQCTICKRHSGKPHATPDPPPLPKTRTSDVPPFTVTGVDFTGTLYVRQNSEEMKVYLCLFTRYYQSHTLGSCE